jgi:hypothetical protein
VSFFIPKVSLLWHRCLFPSKESFYANTGVSVPP